MKRTSFHRLNLAFVCSAAITLLGSGCGYYSTPESERRYIQSLDGLLIPKGWDQTDREIDYYFRIVRMRKELGRHVHSSRQPFEIKELSEAMKKVFLSEALRGRSRQELIYLVGLPDAKRKSGNYEILTYTDPLTRIDYEIVANGEVL
jgi:hypothetical protein